MSAPRYTLSWPGRPDLQKVWLHQDHNRWPGWRLEIESHQEEGGDEHEAYTLRRGSRTRTSSGTRPRARESRPGRPQRLDPPNRPNGSVEEGQRILGEN
eukprot:4977994-Pleurochrysis_carterae.AAC.1